jgi:guanylate kinase
MAKPQLIVFTAPSGAGKTTIVRHLLQCYPQHLMFSVSAATRKRRPHETEGVDYYFMDPETFKQHIQQHDFVEWEEVYPGHFYGTLTSEIKRILALEKSILFDIDIQGALALKKAYPQGCTTIFVQPPSLEILAKRLRERNTEDELSFQRRVEKAAYELSFSHKFDYTLVNEDLTQTLKNAESLVEMLLEL